MTYSDTAAQLLAMASQAESLTGNPTWEVSDDPEVGWVVNAGEVWIALLGPDPAAEFLAGLISQVANPGTLRMLAAWLVTLDEFQQANVVPQELQESTSAVVAVFLGE